MTPADPTSSPAPTAVVTAEDVVRGFLGRDVANLLKYDAVARRGRDQEGVHQLRVNARHLRSELRIVAPVVRRSDREELSAGLRWLGGALGRQRDTDVLIDLFGEARSRGIPVPSRVFARLARQRKAEATRVAALLRSKRYRRLIGRLSIVAVNPPLRRGASRPAIDVLLPGLRSVVADLLNDVDGLGDHPSIDALHEVRIHVKRCRYTCDVAGSFLVGATVAASQLAAVQDVLGDLHDHVTALAYLEAGSAGDLAHPIDDDARDCAAWLTREVDRLSATWRAPLTRARTTLANVVPL